MLFAVLVAAVFASQQHIGRVSATPQVALFIGNLFTLAFVPAFGAMLRLKYISQLAPDIYEAVFERPKRAFTFAAGQYLEWTLPHAHPDARGNRRVFSIASAPGEPDIRIGFRHYERSSSFKAALLAMSPGKYIRVAHVAGNFTLPADLAQPLLFVAGGIGITPLRSMVQQLVDSGRQADVVLLYFAAREQDFVYREVFARAAANGVRAQYIVGRPTAETVTTAAPDAVSRTAYLSGPDPLVSGTKVLLRSMGIPTAHIHTDHFTGY
jgi:ferredoxin-NADP reductase